MRGFSNGCRWMPGTSSWPNSRSGRVQRVAAAIARPFRRPARRSRSGRTPGATSSRCFRPRTRRRPEEPVAARDRDLGRHVVRGVPAAARRSATASTSLHVRVALLGSAFEQRRPRVAAQRGGGRLIPSFETAERGLLAQARFGPVEQRPRLAHELRIVQRAQPVERAVHHVPVGVGEAGAREVDQLGIAEALPRLDRGVRARLRERGRLLDAPLLGRAHDREELGVDRGGELFAVAGIHVAPPRAATVGAGVDHLPLRCCDHSGAGEDCEDRDGREGGTKRLRPRPSAGVDPGVARDDRELREDIAVAPQTSWPSSVSTGSSPADCRDAAAALAAQAGIGAVATASRSARRLPSSRSRNRGGAARPRTTPSGIR